MAARRASTFSAAHPLEMSMCKERDFRLKLLVVEVGNLDRGCLLERVVCFLCWQCSGDLQVALEMCAIS